MTTSLLDQVLALHRHYNQVAELQQYLPHNRPRHANHADKEQRVRDKAAEVQRAARSIPYAGTEYADQIESLIDGCREIQANPYLRRGGIENV